jgi:FkbM family methyltransferase
MGFLHNIQVMLNHPMNRFNKIAALKRFMVWQFTSRLHPHPSVVPFASKSKIIIAKGMTGATGNYYMGLHELDEMAFLLHFLREEEVFFDVGANVGSYTILAASEVGATVVSFEPVPATYETLHWNISINKVQQLVDVFHNAVGAARSTVQFSTDHDTMNHVATQSDHSVFDVEVISLDEVVQQKNFFPTLLKIDVEGFETEVIKGASNLLSNKGVQAIIIELNGSGKRYGYDEALIHQTLSGSGFVATQYDPMNRVIRRVDHYGTHNTIYIRDIESAQRKVLDAKKRFIFGMEI